MSTGTIVIEQPNYVPWIGYFGLMHRASTWVWLDDVQYTRRDWRNRNRIAGRGAGRWITIPVRSKGRFEQLIRDTEINYESDWVAKHLNALHECYRRAPYFDAVFPLVECRLNTRHALLADLAIDLAETIAGRLGLAPRFVRSSSLAGIDGAKQDRLLAICGRFDCATYLSGPRGRGYIDASGFTDRGYRLEYARYDYPPYDRGGAPSSEPLSILDPLFWIGPGATASLIRAHSSVEPG